MNKHKYTIVAGGVLVLALAVFISSRVFAFTWVDITPTLPADGTTFRSIAMSADGMKIATTSSPLLPGGTGPVPGGYIFTSTDGGLHFNQQIGSGSRQWRNITSSADGTHLAAMAYSPSALYTSTDSGVTWTNRTAAPNPMQTIIASASGMRIVGEAFPPTVGTAGHVYLSNDGGATWSTIYTGPLAPTTSPYAIRLAMTPDGTKLVISIDTALYSSSYPFTTWTALTGAPTAYFWQALAVSSDASTIIAGQYGSSGQIYVSHNSGATWTAATALGTGVLQTNASSGPSAVAASTDGTKLFVAYQTLSTTTASTILYSSMNGGSTWTAETPTAVGGAYSSRNAAVSSDGGKIAVIASRDIWVTNTPTTACSISSFTASPATVLAGGLSSLAWSTSGCTGVTLSGGSFTGGAQALSSTALSTGAITATTTYTLTATSGSTPVTATTTVAIGSGPCTIVSFTATPPSVAAGGSSLLKWTTTGCVSVTITGGTFSGTYPPNSTGTSTGPLPATTTFKLTAR